MIKSILKRCLVGILICICFFGILPHFSKEKDTEGEEWTLYDVEDEAVVTDSNHIVLFGVVMDFPLTVSELPEEFHIESRYYTDMTDGIDAGDFFHCSLLNREDEPIAYLRVSNQKANRVYSPEGMTITYIEASTFQTNGKEYGVPMKVMQGIGIGSKAEEVGRVFPDADLSDEEYSVVTIQQGIQTITLELYQNVVHKMTVKAY